MATSKKKTSKAPDPQVPATIPAQAPAEAQIWPLIPSKLEIAERCAQLEPKIQEIELKASTFVKVETEQQAEEALAFVDLVRKAEKGIEKRRKKYTDPPRLFVSTMNEVIKSYTSRIETARKTLSEKILAYRNAKDEKLRKEADEKRRAEEAEAKKRADALAAQGKAAEAQKLLDIAATAPVAKIDTRIRAADGPTSVVTTRWEGEIVSMNEFLKAVVEGKLENYIFPAQHISVQAIPLNKFAGDNQQSEGQTLFGIKVTKRQSLGTR